MEPSARVTQKDLAERCRVSQTTVSRALARSPLLSEETTKRILDEAERIGYRPDPVLSSLNAYLHAKRPISEGTVIAWLGKWPTSQMASATLWDAHVFRAARNRAERLGFKIDYFWTQDPKLPLRRLGKILSSRNVAGLVLDTRSRAYGHLPLDIDRYSVVAIGKTSYSPKVDQVSPDHFGAVVQCYRELLGLGYRKIGLALSRSFADRSHGQWYAAYLLEQHRKAPSTAIPILEAPERDQAAFRTWLRTWKPDCIMTAREDTSKADIPRIDFLQKLKYRIPQDIGVAMLNLHAAEESAFSGIEEQLAHIGEGAVNILSGRISHNQRGVPESRMISHIEGKWREGTTTRRKGTRGGG